MPGLMQLRQAPYQQGNIANPNDIYNSLMSPPAVKAPVRADVPYGMSADQGPSEQEAFDWDKYIEEVNAAERDAANQRTAEGFFAQDRAKHASMGQSAMNAPAAQSTPVGSLMSMAMQSSQPQQSPGQGYVNPYIQSLMG